MIYQRYSLLLAALLLSASSLAAGPVLLVRSGNMNIIFPGSTEISDAEGTYFGMASVGQTDFANENYSELQLLNDGDSDLNVTAISFSGPAATDFSPGDFPTLPIVVPAGGAQSIIIFFSPKETGARRATMSITSNDPARPAYAFLIEGTGLGVPLPLLPEFTGNVLETRVRPKVVGGVTVSTKVTLTVGIDNDGPIKEKPAYVSIALSADRFFDGSDPVVLVKTLRKVAPQRSRVVKLTFKVSGALAATHAFGQIAPLVAGGEYHGGNNGFLTRF